MIQRISTSVLLMVFCILLSSCAMASEETVDSDIDKGPLLEIINDGETFICELAAVAPEAVEISDDDIFFDGELAPGERYSEYDLPTGIYDLLAFECDQFEVVAEQLDVVIGRMPTIWTIGSGVETDESMQASADGGGSSDVDVSASDDRLLTRASDDELRIVPLGGLGESGQATVGVGPEDVSLLFTAIAADPTDQIIVESISGPDGESLYRLINWEQDEFESEMFTQSLFGDGEIVIYLPVAPQFELRPGDYQISLSTVFGDPIPDAFVVYRTDDVDGLQAMDINLWLVSEDPAVTSSQGQAKLSERIRATVDKILNQQNMRLGQLSFFEATDAQIDAYARSSEDDQPETCRAMADVVGTGRALNIIMVDELTPSEVADDVDVGDSTAGLSPSPGSILVPASGTSCVTVAWETHEGDFDDFGATIVHEGSHFFSIQHTSELDGLLFDVLTDTPKCPADQFDDNGDGIVDQYECERVDGANYMFWGTEGLTTDFVISEDQAWVLRRHPLFYPVKR